MTTFHLTRAEAEAETASSPLFLYRADYIEPDGGKVSCWYLAEDRTDALTAAETQATETGCHLDLVELERLA